jgi:hypothetical protein
MASNLIEKCVMISILTILIGLIIGGCVLIWYSTTTNTCSDWSFSDNYRNEKCDYRARIPAALIDCNRTMECACQNSLTFKVSCLAMPPNNQISVSYMIAGVVILVIGIIGITVGGCFFKKIKMLDCDW